MEVASTLSSLVYRQKFESSFLFHNVMCLSIRSQSHRTGEGDTSSQWLGVEKQASCQSEGREGPDMTVAGLADAQLVLFNQVFSSATACTL